MLIAIIQRQSLKMQDSVINIQRMDHMKELLIVALLELIQIFSRINKIPSNLFLERM